MKKKIAIFIGVIILSFLIAFGWSQIKSIRHFNNFLKEYSLLEEKEYIYNEGTHVIYTDENIKKLELVASGELSYKDVEKNRNIEKEAIEKVIKDLDKNFIYSVRKIDGANSVIFGFINKENFLYLYENDYAILCIDNKFYGFKINGIKDIVENFKSNTSMIEANPYY